MRRKILIWGFIIFIIYVIFRSPEQAAAIVQNIWDFIVGVFTAFGDFFDALLA